VRLGPTLERSWAKHHRLPQRLTIGIADLVELYRRGPKAVVPGEPVELSDWQHLEGIHTSDILKAFFPNIGNKEILKTLEEAVDKLHPAVSGK
jgi:hypothetical protein